MKRKFWLLLLFLAALGLRLVDVDDPPLDFHPARQMHSALMARGFYLDSGGLLTEETPEYNHEALSRGTKEPWIEPPLYEKLTAKLYHLFDTVDLRIPRCTSILFWLLGGIGLALLTEDLFGTAGMFGALGWYLFFPYGVIASRSFQPDIPMVCLLLWTLYFLRRWQARPSSWGRMLLFGCSAGLCIFMKQVAAFPIGLAAAFGLLRAQGWGKALKNIRVWAAAVLCLAPMLAYNYWGYFVKGFLVQQYQGRFFLSELVNPAFYVRWFRMIDEVFTVPLFMAALAGIFLIHEKDFRCAALGFFAGYILYGMSLAHHIGTHNYYQLLVFPLTALGIGALISALVRALPENRRCAAALLLCFTGLCCWWAADSVMTLHRRDYRAWPQRWVDWMPELEPYPGSISTIGIMDDYGAGMIYWGLHNPGVWDESVEALDENEALEKLKLTFWNYRFLVVTDLDKFYEQPRLQRYIQENASVYRQEADYIIFELRQ